MQVYSKNIYYFCTSIFNNEKVLKNKYLNIKIAINEENYEFLYAEISELPFAGIEEQTDELVICFEEHNYTDEIQKIIEEALLKIQPDSKIIEKYSIEDKNWNEEWEKNVPAIEVNERIGIAPTWKINELNTEIKIAINPKMSFGTGSHTSTRLCCKLMEKTVKKGSFWIDAGTGTGILAILAVLLGAEKCLAFDNNQWSIENSNDNFILNNVDKNIELLDGDIDNLELPEADGIAANLFINLINSSFPTFYKSLKNKEGDLIVSGILSYSIDEVLENAIKNNFDVIEVLIEEEWAGFHFKARK